MSLPSLVASGRRLVGTTFLDRAILWEEIQEADGQGGVVSTWVAHTDDMVPCRFGILAESDLRGRALRASDGTVETAASAALTMPLEYTLPEGMRVVDADSGRIWQVIGETTPPSATAVQRRVLIREV